VSCLLAVSLAEDPLATPLFDESKATLCVTVAFRFFFTRSLSSLCASAD
jgi:hypothetical protein